MATEKKKIKSEGEATKEERKKAEGEGGWGWGGLKEKQHPEIQASINGAEHALLELVVVVYKYWVSTGLPFNVCTV